MKPYRAHRVWVESDAHNDAMIATQTITNPILAGAQKLFRRYLSLSETPVYVTTLEGSTERLGGLTQLGLTPLSLVPPALTTPFSCSKLRSLSRCGATGARKMIKYDGAMQRNGVPGGKGRAEYDDGQVGGAVLFS